MRSLGAFFVFSAFLAAGLCELRTRTARRAALDGLCASLQLLRAELSARAPSFPALCRQLACESSGEAQAFYSQLTRDMERLGEASFRQLWQRAADELPSLSGPERECFVRLGSVLGRYPLERQLEAIERCLAVLEEVLERSRRNAAEEKRLCLGLPAAAGALLLILLM